MIPEKQEFESCQSLELQFFSEISLFAGHL